MRLIATKVMTFDHSEFERALDSGRVGVRMMNGRVWKARRNGRTRLWKRDAERWAVPIKFGLRHCGLVTNETIAEEFVIESET